MPLVLGTSPPWEFLSINDPDRCWHLMVLGSRAFKNLERLWYWESKMLKVEILEHGRLKDVRPFLLPFLWFLVDAEDHACASSVGDPEYGYSTLLYSSFIDHLLDSRRCRRMVGLSIDETPMQGIYFMFQGFSVHGLFKNHSNLVVSTHNLFMELLHL